MGEHESERHLLFSFVGCVAEHESLIAGSDVFIGSVLVDSLGNIGRLLLQAILDGAGEVVQSLLVGIVANSLKRI